MYDHPLNAASHQSDAEQAPPDLKLSSLSRLMSSSTRPIGSQTAAPLHLIGRSPANAVPATPDVAARTAGQPKDHPNQI
jgi:hypothetical protein